VTKTWPLSTLCLKTHEVDPWITCFISFRYFPLQGTTQRPEIYLVSWKNDELTTDALPIHGYEHYKEKGLCSTICSFFRFVWPRCNNNGNLFSSWWTLLMKESCFSWEIAMQADSGQRSMNLYIAFYLLRISWLQSQGLQINVYILTNALNCFLSIGDQVLRHKRKSWLLSFETGLRNCSPSLFIISISPFWSFNQMQFSLALVVAVIDCPCCVWMQFWFVKIIPVSMSTKRAWCYK
jgi:hypothetical protein